MRTGCRFSENSLSSESEARSVHSMSKWDAGNENLNNNLAIHAYASR